MERLSRNKIAHTSAAESRWPDKTDSTLRLGTDSTAVNKLQSDLAILGYTDSAGRPLKVDGVFGPNTQRAVESFQRDHYLVVDGKVGCDTEGALSAAMSAKVPPSLEDRRNPDHALYEQALAGVHRAEAERGIKPGGYSENLAGALVVAAKTEGLTRIDDVLLSRDGQRAFAEQKGSFPGVNDKMAYVETKDAINASLAQSAIASAQLNPPQDLPLTKTPTPQTAALEPTVSF